MRDVAEIAAFILFLLALVFLFQGDPSIWSLLQKRVVMALA